MDPVESVLISKGACLAFPLVGGQVLGQLLVRNAVHHELRDIDVDLVRIARPLPEAEAAVNIMLVTAEQIEHSQSVFAIDRLAQDLALAFDYGIAADDDAAIDSRHHILRLLTRQSGNELRW